MLFHGIPQVHAQTEVALTASYSIIGGGGSGAQDLITYVSEGQQVIAPLSTSPTVFMVDSGTPWNVLAVLNGSDASERWQASSTNLSGTITVPLTVSFTYYHQYHLNFNFNVTGGGGGYGPPLVTFTQFGSSFTIAASPQWVDAGTSYSYPSSLPGAPQGEEWIAPGATGGTASAGGTVTVSYRHELLITSSYSSLYGSPSITPTLTTTFLGSTVTVPMTVAPSGTWADAGVNYTFTSLLTSSVNGVVNQRWIATTQSGNNLTIGTYTGKLQAPTTVSIVFVHQYAVTFEMSVVGGGVTGAAVPSLTYQSFGVIESTSSNSTMWVDANSEYTLPQGVLGSSGQERWELDNTTTGYIDNPTLLLPVYFHQYYVPFSFAVVGQSPPSPSGQPGLSYTFYSNTLSLTLTSAPQLEWTDAGSSFSAVATLSASTNSERWFAQDATGVVSRASVSGVTVNYDQQYLLTIHGGALPNQWVNAGSNTTLSTPGVFGRSEGVGYRITSYFIDQGAQVTISQPLLTLSIPISMDAPHSITFQSKIQFQVSMDSGAAGALSSITPTTIPGDTGYWYDDGSAVQVVLSGAYGRAHGVGSRIVSVSATAEGPLTVDTVGTFEAYNTTSLASPVSITTTSVTQYEVVLNQAAQAALVSMTPSSSFPGDTGWFNAGSPAVTVVLQGAYGRADGTGMRTTSWELDSNGFTKVAQTSDISITTNAMNSAQFVNATSVTQYQVTLDKGGSTALVSMSFPAISGDTGWYDSGTQVQVVMNGEWGRTAGAGYRLASYSISGGASVPVSAAGQVTVVNVAGISSPQAITTTVVTQYQVSLDQGATAALSSITAPPISADKYWYDSGTPVTISLNGVWGRNANTGDRLVSYSINKAPATSVSTSSIVQVYSNQGLSGPVSVTTTTTLQYHLSSTPVAWASVTAPSIPSDPAWFDSGTTVKATFNDTWSQAGGTRENAASYSIDSGSKSAIQRAAAGSFTVSVTMTQAHTITVQPVQQFLVAIVGPQKVTASPASPTGDYYFDSGSKETFTTSRLWTGTSPGVENMLTSYSIDGGAPVSVQSTASTSFTTPVITFNEGHIVVFNAITQYEVSFIFLAHQGGQRISPAQIGLTEANSTAQVQGSVAWFGNGTTFAVSSVIWEGANVGPVPSPSFTIKGAPLNVTLETSAYTASIRVLDVLGLPVSGAKVSMTLGNGTTISGTTKSNGVYSAGLIPLGTYTAKVTSLGMTSKLSGAPGQTVAEGRVPLGIVSLFILVAIAAGAGAGGFVFLRRSRKKMVSELK